MANHVEETMVRTTWQPQKFTSVEMSTPFQLKHQLYQDNIMEEGPVRSLKDLGNSTWAPIATGVNVQSVGKATC